MWRHRVLFYILMLQFANMKQSLCLLFILTAFVVKAYSQGERDQQKIDSLLSILQTKIADTYKVRVLVNLSDIYINTKLDISLQYAKEAEQIAEKSASESYMAMAYDNLGQVYWYRAEESKALHYMKKGLEIYKELGVTRRIAAVACNMGGLYKSLGNLPESLEYLQMAEKLDEENGYDDYLFVVYINLGNLYYALKDYKQALSYYTKSLQLSEKQNNREGIALSNSRIGNVYGEMYQNHEEALANYLSALKIHQELGTDHHAMWVMMNIGREYLELKDYEKAIDYLNQSLSLGKKSDDRHVVAYCLTNIGDVYVSMYEQQKGGKAGLNSALFYLQKAMPLIREINTPDLNRTFYKIISKAYKLSGNYRAALDAHEQYVIYKDSVFNKDNTEQVARLEVKAVYEKKQLADSIQNADAQKLAAVKLNRQKTFTYSGIAVAIILSVLAFFIAKERKKSDSLLLNILPSEVAAELKKKGESDAQMFDNVTVLFTDFVGFTKVSEQLTPKELVNELHECFKIFDEVMGKYHMEKIKTIGDAYLAVCGLPTADERHAEKVIRAAIEIRNFMLNRHQQLGDRTFEVRIGVHSGELVAGIVGVKKFAYDIWGDTVNTAARMEQNSEAGKINISQTTYELVQDKFTCTYRGELDAKNKGKLKMYFVEG